MSARLEIILDCSQEFDEPSKIKDLMENLMNIFQENDWEYSRDKAILTVTYPVKEGFANELSILSFNKILEDSNIYLNKIDNYKIFN